MCPCLTQRAAGLLLVDLELEYIRDICVWLPDVRWPGFMPVCPQCEEDDQVCNHGFRTNHYARR